MNYFARYLAFVQLTAAAWELSRKHYTFAIMYVCCCVATLAMVWGTKK